MAEQGFLGLGDFVSWPFRANPEVQLSSNGSLYLLPRQGIADAGFVVGPVGDFDPLEHRVYLHTVEHSSGSLFLDFRCDAPEFVDLRFNFSFPPSAEFGCTDRRDIETISGSSQEVYGTGYLTLGVADGLRELAEGVYVVSPSAVIEPARVRDARGASVARINLANDFRSCPIACCSSDVWAEPTHALVEATGLTGDLLFSDGYNMKLELAEADNAVFISADVGFGLGEPCVDWLINSSSLIEGGTANCPSNASCDGFVRSINGLKIDGGNLFLVGDAGVTIQTSSTIHRVVVAPDVNRFCED